MPISVDLPQRLALGIQGEHLAQTIAFDLSPWQKEYGEGVMQLLVQRAGDAEPYPAAVTQQGDTATWQIESADTAQAGNGEVQLLYFVDGKVVKSRRYATFVEHSLGGTDPNVPPAHESWVQQVLAAGSRAAEGAKKAGEAANQAKEDAQKADQARQDAEAARNEAAKHDTAAGNAQKAAELARDNAAGSAKLASDTVVGFDEHAAAEQTQLTQLSAQEKQTLSDLSRQGQDAITQLGTSQLQQMTQQSEQEQQALAQLGTEQRRQIADLGGQVQDAIAKDKAEVQSLAEQTRQDANAVAQAMPIVAQDAGKAAAAAQNAEKAAADADSAAGRSEAGAAKVEETVAGYNADLIERLCTPFDVTGPVVTCHPVAEHPLHVASHIKSVQEGSGDPSPDNVRLIHGVAVVQMVKCGKNLLNLAGREIVTTNPYANTSKREFNGNKAYIGISSTNYFNNAKIEDYNISDDSISLKVLSNGYGIGIDFMVTPGAKIIASPSASGKFIYISFYEKDGTYLQRNGATTTVPSNAYWAMAVFLPTPGILTEYVNTQVNVGEQVESYEPYHGETCTQTLPEEVYGGVYEWDTGKLTKTFARKVLQQDAKWKASGGNFACYGVLGNVRAKQDGSGVCDAFPYEHKYDGGGIFARGNSIIVGTKLAEKYVSLDEFVQSLPSEGITIVYELESPEEPIQLQTNAVIAEPGITTVYSSSGDTTVQGYLDPVFERQELRNAILALGGKI